MKVSDIKKLIFFLGISLLGDAEAQRPLNILFVLHEFPKFNQPFILNQITGLIDRGHNITIYANQKRYSITPPQVESYKLLEKTYYLELPPKKDYDIIYCHFGIDGYVGLELKKRYNLKGKLVTCFRGDDITQFIKPHPEARDYRWRGSFKIPCYSPSMYDDLFRLGDLFLPVCNYFANKLVKRGCDPKKIKVHHSAIDLDGFPFKPRTLDGKKIKLVTVGRLVELKGTEFLINAVNLLTLKKAYKKKLLLYIIGDGSSKKRLVSLVKKLGLKKNVIFLGWLPHAEIEKCLLDSHIFILPSVTTSSGIKEGIPNALMEAMATGMPVISTYHSGIPELVVDNKNGYLVPEKDIVELSKKIKELIKSPKLWKKMGIEGRRMIEETHNITRENDALEDIFLKLVGS